MTTALLSALFLFAIATSITPGPNNMMVFASGVNFGFRRTVPHMLGIAFGFAVLLAAVGLGLGAVLQVTPVLYLALKIAGGLYLLYIALRLATSRTMAKGEARAYPMSFLGAAAFQWVNPKAWVMAITATATYAAPGDYERSIVIIALVFGLVTMPTVSIWTGFGSVLREWLSVPPRLKYFNIAMAILLVLSLWPMLR